MVSITITAGFPATVSIVGALLILPLSVLDFLVKFTLIRAIIGDSSAGGVAGAFRSLIQIITVVGIVFTAVVILPTEIMAILVGLAWVGILYAKLT